MRRIGVVTVGRSDYGIYRPLLEALKSDGSFEVSLFVSGMHLSPEHGSTWKVVEADGWTIADKVDMLMANDAPEGISKSVGIGVAGFAQVFARTRPDILVVLGDRFDMMASVIAALPFKIPVAHLHGGEATFGAFDEAIRHAITKMSHIHFPATQQYADRIVQLGEEPWRVHMTGALAVDNMLRIPVRSREELENDFGFDLSADPLLVTFHPVTLQYESVEGQCEALLQALAESGQPVVFTQANADTNGRVINRAIEEFVKNNPKAWLVPNFGIKNYFSMLRYASAMVGNSSSGILEAPGFGLPAVNIGERQAGRLRGGNVVDVGGSKEEILAGIARALSPEFKAAAKAAPNPYGDGHAAARMVEVLKSVVLDERLLLKSFHDLPPAEGTGSR